MMTALCLILGTTATLAFALSQAKHHRKVSGQTVPPRRLWYLAAIGWVLTLLSTIAAAQASTDWLIGIALVAGGLAAGGVIVTLILSFRASLLQVVLPRRI